MNYKKVTFHSAAREKLLRGAGMLADAVRLTLGPRSKSVLIERKWGKPLVCNDGVTIAKEFQLHDPEENLGAQMIRQAAERTGENVGDGTSTATCLAHAILTEGIRNVTAGASAVDLKRGLERGLSRVVAELKRVSRPVRSRKEKAQVATISAHNEASMGEIVADAMERVGPEGAVTVEESRTTETVLEIAEGLQFDHGYISPYFVTSPDKMESVLENARVLLTDRRISHLQDLLPLLQEIAKQGSALLVIAEDVDGEALATLVLNRLRGVLSCVAVKAPGFGDRRRAMLQDIAIVTGATVVSEETGSRLENVGIEMLGEAKRVVVAASTTTIVGGAGQKQNIEGRCAELRRQITETTSEYDREKLQERLAKLSGGVAVIRVGAPSEAELKIRKDAFDDAISSTKAAVAEGIIPGGGLALLRASLAFDDDIAKSEGDERTGLLILKKALEIPVRQIAENSGADPGVVVERMRAGNGHEGFDAARGRYVDMVEAGIIDPTKVARVALENAVSVASVLLMAEAVMTEVTEEKQQESPPGMADLA